MARSAGSSLPLAAAIAGLLVAYLALFPALFAAGARTCCWRDTGRRALLAGAGRLDRDRVRPPRLFGGFPWVLLGYSQVTVLPVAQLASVTGVYGLSCARRAVSAPRSRGVVRGSSAGAMAAARRDGARRGRHRALGPGATVVERARRQRDGRCASASSRATSRRTTSGSPRAARRDLRHAICASPTGDDRAGRALRPLARVGDAVLLRGAGAETEALRGARADDAARAMLIGSDQWERARRRRRASTTPRSCCQRRRDDRRRVPQDAPRAVRRVRAAASGAVLRGAAGRGGVGLRAGRTASTRCRSAAASVSHGDLLRSRLPGADPRRRARRAASC